jgi:hypothetical protein
VTNNSKKIIAIGLAFCVATVFTGCKSISIADKSQPNQPPFSQFIGLEKFSNFAHLKNEDGETVLLSPEIKAGISWNELVVSWNAAAPDGTFLTVEAAAIVPGRPKKFSMLGIWSPDNSSFPRTSVRGQQDAFGKVDTDTLVLNEPADTVQIRVTVGGTTNLVPTLKFLGLSFANTQITPAYRQPNLAAWGKTIATPEHSQHGYPNEKGWCSPTSLSMVLSRWSDKLNRPEMNLAVPDVAAAVYDRDFDGTGNWPFNTAFAGSFKGMRSYVTRLDDLAEVEDWIAAGIPVVLSARWDWLQVGRPLDSTGHLIVCIGFTDSGDVVVNDPAAHLERGDSVRQIYKREDVIYSWTKSHNAVYLVYPASAKIPRDKYGHWEK